MIDSDALDYMDHLKEQVKNLEAEIAKIKTATAALISESEGVAGLHRNGNLADWDWLIDNGWLPWMEGYDD